ncbi:MAG: PAS domain-containing sensor histidine kinase [Deltaproteobacteria bacterium]|nr:MAG: PAS domain-containing sensor histidine kinase [Deltaproteobacteria bacterium]
MLGSPLARTAAFAALLTVLLVGWEQCASRDLRAKAVAQLDVSLEETARAVAAELGGRAVGAVPAAQLAEIANRAGRAAGVRVTLIDADGFVRADTEVAAAQLAGIENHAHREEVAAAAAGGVGRATRLSHTVGRTLRYVAVPAPGGGVVRISDDFADAEASVALARSHALGVMAIAVVAALALLHGFVWLFHRRPLADVRRMAAAVVDGRLEARAPRIADRDLASVARAIEQVAGQLRSRLREVVRDEAQLGAVLEAMVEGVLVVDTRGAILLANSRLRELFDIHGEITGRPLLEGVRNADLDAILAESAATDATVARSIALPGHRTVQVLAARFPSEGERTGTVTVFHDTTELMRLEEVRRDFVANASHELRTPLAAIRGFAETLLESASLSPEEQKNYLEVIHRHAQRLSNLVEDLLELSTIESRSLRLEIAPVDVARTAENLIADSRLRIEERRISAALRSDGRPLALADARALDQVLGNLLDNALKYTEPGGSIEVVVEERLGRVRVAVVDSGIGIPAEDTARSFERFYRVDRARSRALGGTGLGLSIVKHLVQAMGGDISVKSQLGRGSTFSFTLPRAARGPS